MSSPRLFIFNAEIHTQFLINRLTKHGPEANPNNPPKIKYARASLSQFLLYLECDRQMTRILSIAHFKFPCLILLVIVSFVYYFICTLFDKDFFWFRTCYCHIRRLIIIELSWFSSLDMSAIYYAIWNNKVELLNRVCMTIWYSVVQIGSNQCLRTVTLRQWYECSRTQVGTLCCRHCSEQCKDSEFIGGNSKQWMKKFWYFRTLEFHWIPRTHAMVRNVNRCRQDDKCISMWSI